MLEQQRLAQLAALEDTCAAAGGMGRSVGEREGVTMTLTVLKVALAALLGTILLSGYMVAVG